MEAFHFHFRTPLFPSPFIAHSTKATLWFDHISNRDLGLGNECKSFVEYMYRALCVDNFFICLLPYPFELEVTHGPDKLLFFNRKYVLFRV